jgi:hypothetical protein
MYVPPLQESCATNKTSASPLSDHQTQKSKSLSQPHTPVDKKEEGRKESGLKENKNVSNMGDCTEDWRS